MLSDFEFDGKSLEFISAFSGEEAKSQMQIHPDVAVLLLDVVTDDSGLQVARSIRERLQNFSTRIVLRTGPPGQAPEKMVIMDYDINDCKEKTELTAQKLFTTMITALRSYRDIQTIQKNKEGLMQIIHSSSFMYEAELIRMASPMHDVGKVGVLDAILNKPGKLTPEEFDIMKSHATMGYEMLKHAKGGTISTAALIANQHHEKYNGTGYPNQLKGDEIHIYARITAIADVFDALGSDRVYKKA